MRNIGITAALVLLGWSGAVCVAAEMLPAVSAKPATDSKVAASTGKVTEAAKSAVTSKTNDQLLLDTTLVTGNRELPKVMYIVPWKKADLSDLPGQPFNTLLDEALTPVDREVFQRQVKYYEVVSGKDQPGSEAKIGANQQAVPSNDRK